MSIKYFKSKSFRILLYQLPVWITMILACIGSLYASINKLNDISYGTFVILLIFILLYIRGRILYKKLLKGEYNEVNI